MDWYPSVLNFIEAEYSEYDEWLEKNGFWTGTAEHAVQTTTFKVLTDASKNFIFHSNLHSTKEQAE